MIEDDSYLTRELEAHGEFLFKNNIAESLDVHIRNIAVVGSCKLALALNQIRILVGHMSTIPLITILQWIQTKKIRS